MENRKHGYKINEPVSGYFAMFTLFIGITAIPLFLTNSSELMQHGLLIPLVVTLEFIFITLLYYIFFRKREGLGAGNFRLKTFSILFLIILLVQYLFPYFSGMNKAETWSESQTNLGGYIFWINAILLICIVPVYEEIVFRGCLFNILKFWFRGNIYGAAIVVSLIFSAVHLQYTEIRTFIMLFLVSLTLTAARVKSQGLLMPVILHMLMNTVVAVTQYAAYILLVPQN
ncbi:type II CAAX endopeptidase family protein [Klebsiella pneumoniae]|nr:type II CAAX endopeptidase family protein [Klebsiella pneumoniae]